MATIQILRLEIGYQSREHDTCQRTPPPMKAVLKRHVGDATTRWSMPVPHELPQPPANDMWVRGYLQGELDAALGRHVVVVEEGRDLLRFPYPEAVVGKGTMRMMTGSDGTRCKLIGDVWVNSRSYCLCYADGTAWPEDRQPADALVFATLTWHCWPPI